VKRAIEAVPKAELRHANPYLFMLPWVKSIKDNRQNIGEQYA